MKARRDILDAAHTALVGDDEAVDVLDFLGRRIAALDSVIELAEAREAVEDARADYEDYRDDARRGDVDMRAKNRQWRDRAKREWLEAKERLAEVEARLAA